MSRCSALKPSEQARLERMVQEGCPLVSIRASMILYVAAGDSFIDVAKVYGCSEGTVGKWVRRFEKEGPENLRTPPRLRHPQKITLDLDCQQIIDLERLILAGEPQRSRRAQYILALSRGGTINDVAKAHETSATTIRRWLHRYRDRGTSGLWSRYRQRA